jgi:hypothetical protein
MVSGALAHEVYQSQRVHNAIQGALNRNVHFDIIVGPNYDCESTFILDVLGDSIYVAPTCPEHHFAVGDRRHLRYELRHDEIEGPGTEENMSALNESETSQYLADRFYELKPICRPMKQECNC